MSLTEFDRQPISLLYIDDNAPQRERIADWLTAAGYSLHVLAAWPDDLPGLLAGGRFAATLLHHNPPRLDAIARLSQLTTDQQMPVIVVSALDRAQPALAACVAGAADYLVSTAADFEARLPAALALALRANPPATAGALERRARHLAQVAQAGQQLAATLDPQRVLEDMLTAATSILGTQEASVWVWESAERRQLVCQATSNRTLLDSLRRQTLVPGEGIAGWVVAHDQSAIVPDTRADARFQRAVDVQTGFQTRSILAVPLRASADVIGVLELLNKTDDRFDQEDLAIAEMLATSAAIALENARLVATLRDRTRELQARHDELDAFAQTVAHDLKTPLNWIAGFAELLDRDDGSLDETRRRDYIHSMLEGAHLLSNIVDDLLLLASLRRPQTVLETVSMSAVIERVWQRVAPMVAQYGVQQIERPPRFPLVRGYGPWVEGVWVNYLTNAIQYGGNPPRVRIGYSENGDDFVRFWVEDNGPGLSAAQQAQLFEPFSRPGARHPHGHGLGLSIVRRIIEKLGGEVGVESQLGHGSRFFFSLPRAADSAY